MLKPYIAYQLDERQPAGQPRIVERASDRSFAHVIRLNPADLPAVRVYFQRYRMIRLDLESATRRAA